MEIKIPTGSRKRTESKCHGPIKIWASKMARVCYIQPTLLSLYIYVYITCTYRFYIIIVIILITDAMELEQLQQLPAIKALGSLFKFTQSRLWYSTHTHTHTLTLSLFYMLAN